MFFNRPPTGNNHRDGAKTVNPILYPPTSASWIQPINFNRHPRNNARAIAKSTKPPKRAIAIKALSGKAAPDNIGKNASDGNNRPSNPDKTHMKIRASRNTGRNRYSRACHKSCVPAGRALMKSENPRGLFFNFVVRSVSFAKTPTSSWDRAVVEIGPIFMKSPQRPAHRASPFGSVKHMLGRRPYQPRYPAIICR